ncbi:heavy-metal-associated domain-containing protein [Pseudomonas fluorescens]|uniref:heavy-metal-associated domain-containing protein n=1 Tax=Pseudomonas fluorescens TaxID=294 RepID=UPI000A60CF47|nr:heavy metal translocating P-type ATPase [Pseudomonas fluorescens]
MASLFPRTATATSNPVQQWTLGVAGMTCASCVARVEKALTRVPGVSAASVNLVSETATVEVDLNTALTLLLQAVADAGYRVKEDELVLAIDGMTCASKVTALPGRGLAASVADCDLRLGSSRLMQEIGVDLSPLAVRAAALAEAGNTVSWLVELSERPQLLGLIFPSVMC